jgi:flagellar motor switch protein FliN/FliY
MSFSASPLIPGQPGSPAAEQIDEGKVVEAVLHAAQQALAHIPSSEVLTVGEPLVDADVPLPADVTTAVTAFIGGGVEGKVLFVVGRDLTDALAATPFGALEPTQALKPALETFADTLGARIGGDPTAIAVENCFDVLAGGLRVIVPLLGASGPVSYLGVSLTSAATLVADAPAPASAAAAAAGAASPGTAAGTQAGAAAAAAAASAGRIWGIDMLRDVEMEVTCELGRTRMTVRQLLALAPGDVVELDRLAGAPADLLVNGTLLARGEVVVVDESFGLRITEIVTRDAT